MEFSKEINQTKPFKNESIKAMLNTIYTASKLQELQIKMLKPFNINEQHYNILRILKGKQGEPASPKEIKAVMIFSRGDLTRLIDKLVKLNLVDRAQNSKDRRRVEVLISNNGIAVLKQIDSVFDENKVYDFSLSNTEAELLNNLLDKLRDSKK